MIANAIQTGNEHFSQIFLTIYTGGSKSDTVVLILR